MNDTSEGELRYKMLQADYHESDCIINIKHTKKATVSHFMYNLFTQKGQHRSIVGI
jgi:hypothetical protein